MQNKLIEITLGLQMKSNNLKEIALVIHLLERYKASKVIQRSLIQKWIRKYNRNNKKLHRKI